MYQNYHENNGNWRPGGGALNGMEAAVRNALVQVSFYITDAARQKTNAPNIRKLTTISMKIMEIRGLGGGALNGTEAVVGSARVKVPF